MLHAVKQCPRLMMMMIIIIIIIIIIIMNLIYVAQFDTNDRLTAPCIVIQYIQMQYVHIRTDMKQSYSYTICMPTYKHIHRYMYKYISTDILTRLPVLIHFTRRHTHTNALVRTRTSFQNTVK